MLDVLISTAQADTASQTRDKVFALFDSIKRGERISMSKVREMGTSFGVDLTPKRWKMMLNTWAGINGLTIKECKRETNRAIYIL